MCAQNVSGLGSSFSLGVSGKDSKVLFLADFGAWIEPCLLKLKQGGFHLNFKKNLKILG